MRRFTVINAIYDQSLEKRREANSADICQAPMIGDRQLFPRTSRRLEVHDLTKALLLDVERHVAIGNVRFVEIGKAGEVSIRGLMKDLCMLDEVWVPYEKYVTQPHEVTAEELASAKTDIVAEIMADASAALQDAVEKVFVLQMGELLAPNVSGDTDIRVVDGDTVVFEGKVRDIPVSGAPAETVVITSEGAETRTLAEPTEGLQVTLGEALVETVKDALAAPTPSETMLPAKKVEEEKPPTSLIDSIAPTDVDPEPDKDDFFTPDELKDKKAAELIVILAKLGGKTAGKSKATMTTEILERQAKLAEES